MERKANGKIREISEGRVLLELPLPVDEVPGGIPDAVKELSEEVGLMLMTAAMNSECERITGPKNAKNPLRTANWWGGELSPVYLGGQKVLLERPRLRSKDGKEIPPATYRAFRDPMGMEGSVMKNMILGISSRNYEEAAEGPVRGYGIKKSSVSRHFVKARASLELVAGHLERLNPDAARSLMEGFEETLTLHRLGVTGLLRKTLSTTNPIESCFSVTRTVTGRVKRWRGGDMVRRRAVAALLRKEKKFRRVQGYGEIPKLLAALEKKSVAGKEVAA